MFDNIPKFEEGSADEWLKIWYKTVDANPLKVVFADDEFDLTNEDSERISGCVYGYLKKKGVGREDFVMVHLPRGAHVYVACVGVLKAGAAFVVVEQGYPAERVEAIRADVGCVFELDPEAFAEACAESNYVRGFEHAEDHDAAYAVYTSGTTGKPMGVIQERGSMYMSYLSACEDNGLVPEGLTNFASVAPMNFSASMLIFSGFCNLDRMIYIAGYDTVKNPAKLLRAFAEREITTTFMAPSMLRALADKLPESLKIVIVGAAPADRAWAGPSRTTYNYYMSTETCFVISKHIIESPEDNPTVGRPAAGIEARVGEEGEVVVRAPFCRGYIGGNPEGQSGAYFLDGEFHSSDLASIDDDGLFWLRGRTTDMVKIDGNRVEPVEVETAFRAITGLECVARGFEDLERNFVALYYVPAEDAPELDTDAVRREMNKRVPYYMVPAHIVPIEAIPLSPLGKIDRKALPRPASTAREYVAPRDELEERLCVAAQKILDVERVGIADDFFEIGGSSMDVVAMLGELDMNGLSANHFYRARTIGGVAEQYRAFLEESAGELLSQEEKELEGRKHRYFDINSTFITGMQMADPELTEAMNFSLGFRFSRLVSIEKMCKAVNTYTSSSSTFKTKMVLDEQNRACYEYAPELYKPIEIEKMTEEEVEELQKTFVQPHRIFEELPWRIRLIRTKKQSYLFFDIHHVLTDAAGLGLMIGDIANVYLGKPVHTNNLFAWEYDIDRLQKSPYYQECLKKVYRRVEEADWAYLPNDPTEETGRRTGVYPTGVSLTELNAYLKREHLSRGDLLCATMALTLAHFTKKRDVRFSSIFDNRLDATNIAGMRARGPLNVYRLGNPKSFKEYLSIIKHGVQEAIATSCVRYYNPNERVEDILVYLDDIGDLDNIPKSLEKIVERIDVSQKDETRNNESVGLPVWVLYQNKGDSLNATTSSDIHFFSDRARDEFMKVNNDILRRIIAGDESVLTDYLPA